MTTGMVCNHFRCKTTEKKVANEKGVFHATSPRRLFLSAEPAPTPEQHIIPQSILEASIKITNEPPTGMQANLHKAFDNFDQVSTSLSIA